MTSINIIQPDDWHVHLRGGDMLKAVLPYTARSFGRAIVMPNLKPPVVTTAQAAEYRKEILAALPADAQGFQPLMAAYLTDGTDADDIAKGFAEKILAAVKLYPANATTNSEHGVTDLKKTAKTLERMQRVGMPLLVHGEVTDADVDIFDREAAFIDKVMIPLRRDFPELKVVFEHVTTRQAVDYVMAEGGKGNLGATITAHHLRINRNAIFAGGIRPHYYCLPIAKREEHRRALVAAATSGKPMFFLGTDTAPHPKSAKESACGCAGIFTAPNAIEIYAAAFHEAGALDRLESFASLNGPAFYGLPPNQKKIKITRGSQKHDALKPILASGGVEVIPFLDEESLFWKTTS